MKKSVSRGAPCPCGSGRKYKKCCLPPADAGIQRTWEGRGPASQMVVFSQPFIDAAGGDPQKREKARLLGMLFWNLANTAEFADGDDIVREQLMEAKSLMARTDEDRREFRNLTVIMFDRYAQMRPGARTKLQRIIENLWGPDLASPAPKTAWFGKLAGTAKSILGSA